MIIERIAAFLHKVVEEVRAVIEPVREHVHDEAQRLEQKIDKRIDQRLGERLDEIAATNGATDWRKSAEDLAKVAGEDGTFKGRRQLWSDVGFTDKYEGTAEQNDKLHDAMYRALVENYGLSGLPRD